MMPTKDTGYITLPGIDFGTDKGGPHMTLFGISLHSHSNKDEFCSYRWGIIISVLGVHIRMGMFRYYDI